MEIQNTLAERGARYGDFSDHALIAQELQTVMHTAETRDTTGARMIGWHRLSAVQKQALTVIADKIARILSGDPNYTDNWHDIQGYAKLAEDRCVDDSSPQLPLGDEPQSFTIPMRPTISFADDKPDLMHEHGNVERHLLQHQGDEFFCPRCAKRWGVDEPAPGCRE